MLHRQCTVLGQLLVGSNATLDGCEANNLYLLHATRSIGHNLARNVDNTLQDGSIVTEVRTEHRLAQIEMHVERTLLFAENAGTVVGLVLRDMSQHGVVALQLSGTACEVGHSMDGRHERLGFHHDGLRNNNRLNGNRLLDFTWTTRNVINDINAGLRHQEKFRIVGNLRAAKATGKTVELGITHSDANQCLHIPIATQWPGIAIESADGNEVTLATFIAH